MAHAKSKALTRTLRMKQCQAAISVREGSKVFSGTKLVEEKHGERTS